MDVSCHSFIRMARLAEPLMKDGGALFTMSYFGAEKVVENYNLMGPVKAALEASARYLAAELGPKGIRVHAISPGPLKTRAASGIADFDDLLERGRGARAGAQPGDHRGRRLRDRRARDRRRPADHRRYHLHRRRLPHHGLTCPLRQASLGTAPLTLAQLSLFPEGLGRTRKPRTGSSAQSDW